RSACDSAALCWLRSASTVLSRDHHRAGSVTEYLFRDRSQGEFLNSRHAPVTHYDQVHVVLLGFANDLFCRMTNRHLSFDLDSVLLYSVTKPQERLFRL